VLQLATRRSTEHIIESGRMPKHWSVPKYTRREVNEAGRLLANAESSHDVPEDALEIINNWRSAHSWPLNTFKLGLVKKARQVSQSCTVAQRLKRLSSIAAKLQRFPEMKLSQMQDIAGCRAIVPSVAHVRQLVKLFQKSDIKHQALQADDYITNPKDSGYRSVHLKYKYFSDKNQAYNNLKVEIQLRSRLQHAWATAVETAGLFTDQALKSSQGSEDWLRFFALMGSAIALREKTPLVPNTPHSRGALKREISEYAQKLQVIGHLKGYTEALKTQEQVGARKDAHYYLIELDPLLGHLRITGYTENQLDRAMNDYLNVERSGIGSKTIKDSVLVSVLSINALKRAYPNYFIDTHRFIHTVEQVLRAPIGSGGSRGYAVSQQIPLPL